MIRHEQPVTPPTMLKEVPSSANMKQQEPQSQTQPQSQSQIQSQSRRIPQPPTTVQRQKHITFNPAMQVILIPSRNEYKQAKLISVLWWGGADFFSFQQSAYSELRLLSSFDNISMKDAKTKMYQPNSQEMYDDNSAILERMGSSNNSEYDDYFAVDTEQNDDENDEIVPSKLSPSRPNHQNDDDEDNGPTIVISTAFHKVSSLDCISAHLRHEEVHSNNNGSKEDKATLVFPKVSSLDCMAAAVRELDAVNDDTATKSSQTSSWMPSTRGASLLSHAASWSTMDEDAILQLCVPLTRSMPLATGPVYSNRKKGKKGSFSSSTIALYSSILLVAFVLVDRYCGAIMSMH